MLTVVLGGARSGKSALVERFAAEERAPVTFVATSPRIEGDTDLNARIARHRADRPATWTTVEEELDLAAAIGGAGDDVVVVDCLTLWVSNMMFAGRSDDAVAAGCDRALDAVAERVTATLVVTNEVGLGIVPADADTRRYRDLLGRVNQRWVHASDRALLLVAGRALELSRIDEL